VKHSDPLFKFLISWIASITCDFSPTLSNNSCCETIIYLVIISAHTSIKLGGHHDSENQVLHFLRKRSAHCCGSGLPVLRGRHFGGHVMLSQALISLLLMAGILAVCTLTIRYLW
jgi:hypothetical protein